jgi:tRNA 2-thiouridine synthesizing protein A
MPLWSASHRGSPPNDISAGPLSSGVTRRRSEFRYGSRQVDTSKSPEQPLEEHLDVKGLLCPMPVLKARKRLLTMPPGALLRVEATDPASVIDFPHFCSETGHVLVGQEADEGIYRFVIRRRAA